MEGWVGVCGADIEVGIREVLEEGICEKRFMVVQYGGKLGVVYIGGYIGGLLKWGFYLFVGEGRFCCL